MAIYGTALLAICLLLGLMIGKLLGLMIGVQANVGGVGIAMLLLIFLCDRMRRSGRMKPLTEQGILFWSAIYIPIVVAMAASQNVVKAIDGGALALVAGVLVVAVSFAMVPLIDRFSRSAELASEDVVLPGPVDSAQRIDSVQRTDRDDEVGSSDESGDDPA